MLLCFWSHSLLLLWQSSGERAAEPTQEIQQKLWAPGFGLFWLCPLQPFGEWIMEWKVDLCLSVFLPVSFSFSFKRNQANFFSDLIWTGDNHFFSEMSVLCCFQYWYFYSFTIFYSLEKKIRILWGKKKHVLVRFLLVFFFSFSFLSLWLHCCALTQEFQFHSAAFLLSSYRWEKVTVGYLLFVYLLFLIFFLLKMYYFSWKCRFTVSRKNK